MKLTNALNLPQPFVDAATSDYRYKDKRYSVTAVMKGARQAILERRHADEITNDVADMVWAIFGTAVHRILQDAEETKDQLKENWLAVDMPNGYQLSGIFDLYDDFTGTVTDYKTCSEWKVVYREFEDWRKQTLIYCWMLRQIGFDARRGEIVAIIKDHNKRKAETESDYPKHPVYRIAWDFTEKDFKEIAYWLNARFVIIADAEKVPDEALPLCSDEERWHKPDKWAVKKKGNKRAKRVFESEAEARAMAEAEGLEIEFRPGEDGKCKQYCSACEFCTYWQQTYGKEA